MIGRIRNTFGMALYYLRTWEKETNLNAKQIARIEDLRKEIKDLCSSDLCPTPQTEFQKIEQLKDWRKLYEDNIQELTKITPENIELDLLLNEISSLLFQICSNYHFRLSTLSESAQKEFFQTQTPQTKTIDKDNELQKKLVNMLGGRKELAEELINTTSQDVLHNWCKAHSSVLCAIVRNRKELHKTIKELNTIEDFTIGYTQFNNWIKGN